MSTIKGNHIITRIQSSTYTLKWSIDKYAKILSGKILDSPIFHPIAGTEWYSQLAKGGTYVEWVIYNKSYTDIHVQHDVTVVDYKGTVLFEKSLSKIYTKDSYYCRLIETFETISLNENEHVTFVCHMTLTGNDIKSEITEIQSSIPDSVKNLKKLSDDLKTMYGVSLYTDVCLRVDGAVLRAHRALLSARSPVFAKMFEHELKEKETNEIIITDLETDVLKQLISFLYTGFVLDESFESVMTLYYAADKYDVTDLRQRCGDIIMTEITVENACRVLTLAERHSDISLKKSAIAFVETYLEPIFATEGWKELLTGETSLAAEAMIAYIEKRNPQKANTNCEKTE